MYSIVQSFASNGGKRFVYGCDACGKQADGKLDEKQANTVNPPIGWIVDFGPGSGAQPLSVTCSEECRDRLRRSRGILTLDQLEEQRPMAEDTPNEPSLPLAGPQLVRRS